MQPTNTTNTIADTGGHNISGPGGPVIDSRRPKRSPRPAGNFPKGGSKTGLPKTSKAITRWI
ncbi:hypothetical protein ACWEQ4_01290 [Rhodococcus sp. NPDC003994]